MRKATCQYDKNKVCVQCNVAGNPTVKRTCNPDNPKYEKLQPDYLEPWTPKLGDWTESQLKKFGITQEWYKEVKDRFGLAPQCNCSGRIEQLNEWSTKVFNWWQGVTK